MIDDLAHPLSVRPPSVDASPSRLESWLNQSSAAGKRASRGLGRRVLATARWARYAVGHAIRRTDDAPGRPQHRADLPADQRLGNQTRS